MGAYQLGYRLKAEQQGGTPGWNDTPKLCNATLERPSSILCQESPSDAGPKCAKTEGPGSMTQHAAVTVLNASHLHGWLANLRVPSEPSTKDVPAQAETESRLTSAAQLSQSRLHK